jgi:hypothetical protein
MTIIHLPPDADMPMRLEPGEPYVWSTPLGDGERPASVVARLFAEDSRGRYTWWRPNR